jgi:hypothetical protein
MVKIVKKNVKRLSSVVLTLHPNKLDHRINVGSRFARIVVIVFLRVKLLEIINVIILIMTIVIDLMMVKKNGSTRFQNLGGFSKKSVAKSITNSFYNPKHRTVSVAKSTRTTASGIVPIPKNPKKYQ